MIYRKAKRVHRPDKWSDDEITFLKLWYGAARTESISQVIGRTGNAIVQYCLKHGIEPNEHIYTLEPIKATYKGESYMMKGFKGDLKPVKKPSFVVKRTVKPEPKTEPAKPTPKPSLFTQTREIKPFVPPEGKKLVPKEPGSKVMVYR